MSIIAKRLISAREAANLTQEELAGRLGITQEAYGAYERERTVPGIDRLMEIASHLGRPITYFLGINGELSEEEGELLAAYRSLPTVGPLRRFAIRSVQALRQALEENRRGETDQGTSLS